MFASIWKVPGIHWRRCTSSKARSRTAFPALCRPAVLILDDYGYWQGARKAVDEYFAAHDIRPLMGRVDFAGRVILKP